MDDTISRQAAIDAIVEEPSEVRYPCFYAEKIKQLPPTQSEDYVQLKREFIRMAQYIDALLYCPDEQKETLNGFILRIAEFMPWTEALREPKQRWIPVTERLPKPYEYCLWTTTDGRVIYHHCDGLFSNYIAWMPLPEPYERSEDAD